MLLQDHRRRRVLHLQGQVLQKNEGDSVMAKTKAEMAKTKAEKLIHEFDAEVRVGERVLSKAEAVEHLSTYTPAKVGKKRQRYSAINPRRPKAPKTHTHRGLTWGELAKVRVWDAGEQRSLNTTIKTMVGGEFEPDTPVVVTCKTLAGVEMWSARPDYGRNIRGGLKTKMHSGLKAGRIEVELFGEYPCGLVKLDPSGTVALAAAEREHVDSDLLAAESAAKKSLWEVDVLAPCWRLLHISASAKVYEHRDGHNVYWVDRLGTWANSKKPVTHHKTVWHALNKRNGWEVDAEGEAVDTPSATETTAETPEPIATPVAVEPEQATAVRAKTVIVCGSRTFTDFYQVQKVLDARRDYIEKVVTGGGRGADGLAMQWALENGVSVQVFEADWERFKRAAGPMRNKRMVGESGAARVIAFAGGAGTLGICELAARAGLVVERIPARADGQPEPQVTTQPAPPARPKKIDSAQRVESIAQVEAKARASGEHIGRALASKVMAEIETAATFAAG